MSWVTVLTIMLLIALLLMIWWSVNKMLTEMKGSEWTMRNCGEKLDYVERRIDFVMGAVQDVSRHLTDRLILYRPECDSNPEAFQTMKMWLRIELDYFCLRRGTDLVHWAGMCTCSLLRACSTVLHHQLKPGYFELDSHDSNYYESEAPVNYFSTCNKNNFDISVV